MKFTNILLITSNLKDSGPEVADPGFPTEGGCRPHWAIPTSDEGTFRQNVCENERFLSQWWPWNGHSVLTLNLGSCGFVNNSERLLSIRLIGL